jgi:putative membrane protein
MISYIKTTIYGFLMGTAEVIPGVSGSTIALIFNIYDSFVNLLYDVTQIAKGFAQFVLRKKSFKELKQQVFDLDYKFAIPLGIGTVLAVITMSSLILYVLETYPQYLYALLLGLVLSVVVVPIRQMQTKGLKEFIIFICTFVILFFILGQQGGNIADPSYLLLFLAGALAISGLVLPGVSGSFILLVLGVYYYIIDIVHSLVRFEVTTEEFVKFGIFILGVGTGFLIVVQLLKKALDNYRSELMAFILGLLLGSARVLWPFVETITVDGDIEIVRKSISEFPTTEVIIISILTIGTTILFGILNYMNSEIVEE